MTCQDARNKLTQYEADSLAPAEREAVRAHLESCRHCQAEFAASAQLADLLTPMAHVSAPPELWAGIRAQLRPRHEPWWRAAFTSPRPAILAAAATLVAAVGLWAGFRGDGQLPPAEALASTYQEQQIVADWASPLADDAALGVMFASLGGNGTEP